MNRFWIILILLIGFSPDAQSKQNLSAPTNGCASQARRENFGEARTFYGENMSKVKNKTGLRFGRLSVIGFAGLIKRKAVWDCICDCGKTTTVTSGNLTPGGVKSCGCVRIEKLAAISVTHGATIGKTETGMVASEYSTWLSMRARCRNKNNKNYSDYGGRGISVCERWENSFENFLADMGNKPTQNHTIDRKENDGNYEPSNCRWATVKEQQHNRRSNRIITHNGKSLCMEEWATMLGCKGSTLLFRLKSGWTISDVVSTPIGQKRLSIL